MPARPRVLVPPATLAWVIAIAGCGEVPEPPPAPVPAEPARFPADEADPRLGIAQRLLRGGRFAEAETVLAVLAAERPDDARIGFLLGLSWQKQRRYGPARTRILEALAVGGDFPERRHADHFLGWCAYYLGEPDEAARRFRAHLELVPDEPDSLFGLGLVALDAGDLDGAETLFARAIELQSGPDANRRDLAKARARLGDVRGQRDRHEEAEALYMESLAAYPNGVEVWEKLARVRDRLGKDAAAASARNEAERARARRGANDPEPAPSLP